MNIDLTRVEDRLQDMAESFEDLASSIRKREPTLVNFTPPAMNVAQPDVKVDVAPPSITVPVTIEKINPTMWEFIVTARDNNGRISKFTATPV
jgi:hypothetical protein